MFFCSLQHYFSSNECTHKTISPRRFPQSLCLLSTFHSILIRSRTIGKGENHRHEKTQTKDRNRKTPHANQPPRSAASDTYTNPPAFLGAVSNLISSGTEGQGCRRHGAAALPLTLWDGRTIYQRNLWKLLIPKSYKNLAASSERN